MALNQEQRKVLAEILRIGRQKGASPKELKAAIETGLVESNLRNLPGGDADSAGWRQERASIYRDPTNLDASIARFFNETRAVRSQYGSAGALAAAVQRPAAQFRGRYQQRSGEAQTLLGGSNFSGGNLGAPQRATSSVGSLPFTTTDPQAQRRVAFANYLQQADPGSSLLRMGVVSPYEQTTQTGRLPGVSASPSAPRSTAGGISGKRSPLLELFWQGPGGINAKNGKLVPQGFVSGHTDHVHVAAGPKTVVQLGKLAQRMGLHVGENPHFGGVTPVHTPGSYHYKGEAIDVSGDPAKERAFAHRVASIYGIGQ
jgi:hypothetical protein